MAIVFAVLGFSLMEELAGFLIGAVLGALLAQVLHLRARARSLEEQLRALRQPLAAQPVTAAAAAAAAEAAPAQTTRTGPPADAMSNVPRAAGSALDEASPTVQNVPRPPAPFERIRDAVLDWLKRGNPLARIGIVILFLGATFLVKYAAENSLFPIELRFVCLALGAFALLIVGWRLRERRSVYAQLLQGGGVAGLYLTVFAATKLYELLPLGFALALMVVVALAAALIAVAQNALSLAVIGTAGGFLAPVLVASGGGNHVALFSYYAVLNLGVFAVAWFRTWRALNVLGFLFTFTVTGLWRIGGYERAYLLTAELFLGLFFLMYAGVSILNSWRQPQRLASYVSGSLVFGLPIVAFGLHVTLVSHIDYALAWSALALGAFYLLLAWMLFRTRRTSLHLLVEAFAALGVIFASLAIPLAFDTRTTAAMWAVEGAGLLWLGVRQQRRLARAFGTLLQLGAGAGYLLRLHGGSFALPVLNSACLGALMIGVSGLFSAYWLHRNHERQARYEAGAEPAFVLWGLAWCLHAGMQEIERFLPLAQLGATLSYVASIALVLAVCGRLGEWRLARRWALWLPLAAGWLAAGWISAKLQTSWGLRLHPFAQWGALGWLLIVAAQLVLLRGAEREPSAALPWLHAALAWLCTLLVAWEASWQIGQRTSGVWASLPWGLAPALLLAWLGRRRLVPDWPFARHAAAYRLRAAPPLVAVMLVWIIVVNLTSSGASVWLPYLSLFNPLDVGTALCFVSLGIWWSALTTSQRRALWRMDIRVAIGLLAAIVFLWLNAALVRSLHHHFSAPIAPIDLLSSTLVQAALSIFWAVLGFTAMTLAARWRWRYVWLAGATLMVVVVAKLLLVDLSNVGTIARITSFLTVGALLLVTGYLAPLPPRRIPEQANA